MPFDRKPLGSDGKPLARDRKPSKAARQRSAVTNGTRPFVLGDGNSAWARRWGDILEAHASDLGGWPGLSEAQISLAKRASAIEVQLEQMEGAMSEGADVDLDKYTRAAGHLRRILETLGIERRAKDVTEDLGQKMLKQWRADGWTGTVRRV
jgi:hypothetical protein